MDMVWTLGKDPSVPKPDHDEGEWMEEGKIFCGCACDKSQGRTSERPHRNIPQRFNWSISEEDRDIRAAEAFILICAWLRRRVGGGGEKQIKLKDPQSDVKKFCLLQHLCRLAIISWLHFYYKTTKKDSRIVTFKTAKILAFLSHFPNVQVEILNTQSPY